MCEKLRLAVEKQDDALRQWQATFNEKILQPKGIFLKSQSCCWFNIWEDGKGGKVKVRSYLRWFAFAFGPAATRNLKMQPHLHGDIELPSCLCGGPDESVCCCHP